MRSRSMLRKVAVLSSAALVLGAFLALPAEAGKRKKKRACPAYVPSQWSAEAEILKVTDAHTAEAPLEVELEVPAGAGTTSNSDPDGGDGAPSHVFINVQVDTKAKTSGLYAQIEYTPVLDYDLYVRDNAGIGLAYSAGFAPGVPFLDGTGNGGHTDVGTENVEGLTTNDCTGYLIDIAGATTPGETVPLRLWVGEATFTPGG